MDAKAAEFEYDAQKDLNSWENKLISTCDNVIKHLNGKNKIRNKILHKMFNVSGAIKKVQRNQNDVLLELLHFNADENGLGKRMEEAAKDLYLVEEYREAEANRLSNLVRTNLVTIEESFTKSKGEIIQTLKESNRCILAERKAMEQFKESLKPHARDNTLSRLLLTKKSTREWDIGMKRAQWAEAHSQVEHMIEKINKM